MNDLLGSDETLHGLGRIAAEESTTENPLIIQSHMSESADEIAWVRSTRHERTDPVIFDAAGLLGPHSVMAHCTNLPLQDRELLLQRGTSIASCPLSNAYFSDRPFPMREAIDEGMKVGLGSDIAGGYSLDVGNSMRTAVLVSKYRNQHEQLQGLRPSPDTPSQGMNKDYSITWIESLYLATRGGAASLSPPLPERAGLIEEGAPFDAQLILTLDEDTGCGVGPLSTFADP